MGKSKINFKPNTNKVIKKGYTVEDFTTVAQVDKVLERSEERLEELERSTPVDAKRVAANYKEKDALWARRYELFEKEKGN